MMDVANRGNLSILRLLLQHSANPDMQSYPHGLTALMIAAITGQEAYVKALLHARAKTELLDTRGFSALQHAEAEGHTAIAELIRQHAAPPQPTARDASEVARSSLASLPELLASAERGELQKVVEWLRKGGKVDALGSTGLPDSPVWSLLHAAVHHGHLEMVRELLKRGASVDLQSCIGANVLMAAAGNGHLSMVLVLLQHTANPDLQNRRGATALMFASYGGQEACVRALLRFQADTELLNEDGLTALQMAEAQGHTATAKLIRQHAACLSFGLGVALCAVPLAWPWVVLSLMLGAIASVAFSRNLTALSGQHRAAQQNGRTTTAGPIRQHTASPLQPAGAEPQAELQAVSVAERAEAAQQVAIAGGLGMPALEVAIASAPCTQGAGGRGVGAEARAQCDRLLEAQQEAQRKTEQESAAEAVRLAAAEQAREVAASVAAREPPAQEASEAARTAVRVAAASKAREVAVTAAAVAVAAEAEASALERAASDGGERGSSGTAGVSEASEVAVPDQYMCSITAEIMTDPVTTARSSAP